MIFVRHLQPAPHHRHALNREQVLSWIKIMSNIIIFGLFEVLFVSIITASSSNNNANWFNNTIISNSHNIIALSKLCRPKFVILVRYFSFFFVSWKSALTWWTGEPSARIHSTSGDGLPWAVQSTRPPELLLNSTRWGGSWRNNGPCRSTLLLHTTEIQ